MDSDDNKAILFPSYRDELVSLFDADQTDIKSNLHRICSIKSVSQKNKEFSQLRKRNLDRAKRMITMLDAIVEPTIDNIGLDGSEALALIALHSNFAVMESVLSVYQKLYIRDKTSVYFGLIPSLVDRLSIRDSRKQIYGTHWMLDSSGSPFLVEVVDFTTMDKNRKKFGLASALRPINLAVGAEKYPLGRGKALTSDQKKLSDDDYNNFIKQYS